MENNMIRTDKEASAALKQKALPYLPRNLGDVTAQKQILAMIAQVVPAAASYATEADTTIWSTVTNAKLPINHAIAQCAYQTDRLIGSGSPYARNLSTLPEKTLLQAWIALDYYAYILKAEYSVNLRLLQQQIERHLLSRETVHAQVRNAVDPSRPRPRTVVIPDVPAPPAPTVVKEEIPGTDEFTTQMDTVQTKPKAVKPVKPKTGKAKPIYAVLGLAVVVLIVSLVASFMLSDTHKAKSSIQSIGTVTLKSEEKILHAEQLYAELTENQQEKISNRDKLFAARAEYDSLVAEAAIEAIGKVTPESTAAIVHAEEVYAALSGDEKNLVDNYKTLTSARKELDRLDAAIKNASDAIDAIGLVTLESGKKIETAKAFYTELEKDGLQKYLQDKASTLDAAEKEYRRLVSQDLYDTGISHQENQRYEDAIACFDTIVADYSDTTVLESARKARADCQIALADQACGKRDYYSAMNALNAVEETYRSLDSYQKTEEKVLRGITGIRPGNGSSVGGSLNWGQCYVNVTAADQDICVKVESASDPAKYKLVFVRAGQTAKINVADGTYSVKWVTGTYWYGKDHLFGDDAQYRSLPDDVSFTTTRQGNWIHYQLLTLDLTDPTLFPFIIQAEEF